MYDTREYKLDFYIAAEGSRENDIVYEDTTHPSTINSNDLLRLCSTPHVVITAQSNGRPTWGFGGPIEPPIVTILVHLLYS